MLDDLTAFRRQILTWRDDAFDEQTASVRRTATARRLGIRATGGDPVTTWMDEVDAAGLDWNEVWERGIMHPDHYTSYQPELPLDTKGGA